MSLTQDSSKSCSEMPGTWPRRSEVLICSPALAEANNGNWQTASRWARMLKPHCRIGIVGAWAGEPCDLLIALHARRSATSVAAFRAAHAERRCIVVLTGTDLYRDIQTDPAAQASLQIADRLVVLQQQGIDALPPQWRNKAVVIHQSARRLTPVPPPLRGLKVVFVAHLRDEKDPLTLLRAAVRLRDRPDIRVDIIGSALDASIARAVSKACSESSSMRWLGGLPRARARQHIRRAQLLVNCSRMEGGAHVILEAALSGTAVLASRIPGNVGMLGVVHAGLFDLGDDLALASLMTRAADDPGFLKVLRQDTTDRAALFDPAVEQRTLQQLVTDCLEICQP